jgi:hypothetical protein
VGIVALQNFPHSEQPNPLFQCEPELRSEAQSGKDYVSGVWINSADDFINPPELGSAQQQVKRMPHARFILLPITDATRGHGTHTVAAVWKDYLAEFMQATAPDR